MASWLRRLDPRVPSVAITVALASFHTSLLVLVIVLLAYLGGGLGDALADLNTVVGLGLFVYLWVITWVTSAGALRRLGWPRHFGIERVMEAGAIWGGFTGATSVAVPGTIAVVAAFVVGVATLNGNTLFAALLFVPFTVIGSLLAFAVGAVLGLAFGLIDTLLFAASRPAAEAAVTGSTASEDEH
jgi:hypothetical protein